MDLGEKIQRRKHNPVILAGSSLGPRGFYELPQQAPQESARKKVVRLEPSQLKPLCCPHGVELTQEEYKGNLYEFSNATKKRAHEINRGENNGVNLVLLRSGACVRCTPVCDHKQPMSAAEVAEAITTGKRFSAACAACTRSENPEAWERVLKAVGLPERRGRSPVKLIIEEPGSTRILGEQKNFQTADDIEHRDAASTISRDDMPAKSRSSRDAEGELLAGLRAREFEGPDPEEQD